MTDETRRRTFDPSEPPDAAGHIATCQTCGTSVGPVTGYTAVSVRLACMCGTILEVFPGARSGGPAS